MRGRSGLLRGGFSVRLRSIRKILRDVLEIASGEEAYDVPPGMVRIGDDPAKTSVARLFASLAEAGEGYEVELDRRIPRR
jgi:hypothetical protein